MPGGRGLSGSGECVHAWQGGRASRAGQAGQGRAGRTDARGCMDAWMDAWRGAVL